MANDKLISSLIETINKKRKGFSAAQLLGPAGENAAVNVKDWISTGSSLLDLAISNKANAGVAAGRVTELTGMEGSGKSLIGSQILASTQKMGGIAVYIDTESAVSIDFLRILGVDVDKLIYIQLETIEEIYETIEKLIASIRESDKKKLVTILVDSMSAATTEMEQEADYTRDGWSTGKAIINSKAMRKITNLIAKERIALILTNQLRTKLGISFGDNKCVDPYTTKIKIRYKMKQETKWIEEELTIAEFAEKFLGTDDFSTVREIDIKDYNIEIFGKDLDNNIDCYKPMVSFIVKPAVEEYFTDGNLKGTAEHRVIENKKDIYLKDHEDFKKVTEKMKVVDFEIPENHNYYANGRLNHNTTSGGVAIGFHSSTRIRLTKALKIKDKTKEIIGLYIKAKIMKSRFGPTYRTVEFPLYFTSGIDDDGSLLLYLKSKKLLSSGGAWYTMNIVDKNGEVEELKFMSKDWTNKLNKIPGFRNYVYNLVCENFIMKYELKKEIIDIDSIEVEKDNEPDEPYESLTDIE